MVSCSKSGKVYRKLVSVGVLVGESSGRFLGLKDDEAFCFRVRREPSYNGEGIICSDGLDQIRFIYITFLCLWLSGISRDSPQVARTRFLDRTKVRGQNEEVVIYEVLGIESFDHNKLTRQRPIAAIRRVIVDMSKSASF